MGKQGKGNKAGNDNRAREKVNHRGNKRRGDDSDDAEVPQELIDKAALLGCQVWEVEEYEQREKMKERDSDEEEDSDLSEESKAAVKPKKAKANMAAANREMPPSSSDEEDEGVEPIVE